MKQSIYRTLKGFFNSKEEILTQEQVNYILSGFSESLLKDYSIVYSPSYISMTLDKEKRNFYSRSLENKFDNNFTNSIEKIRLNFKNSLENIKVNSLRKINEINSSLIDSYREGINSLKKINIQEKTDGTVIFKFS